MTQSTFAIAQMAEQAGTSGAARPVPFAVAQMAEKQLPAMHPRTENSAIGKITKLKLHPRSHRSQTGATEEMDENYTLAWMAARMKSLASTWRTRKRVSAPWPVGFVRKHETARGDVPGPRCLR